MNLAFGQDVGCTLGGQGGYKDPIQNQIVQALQQHLHWDLGVYDQWLFGSDHWRGYPKSRQRLIAVRHQLTAGWHNCPTQDGQLLCLQHFLWPTCQIALPLKNMPEALRQAMSAVRPPPAHEGRLDAQTQWRLRRMYQQLVGSGQKYGARTRLAAQYGLSINTVRRVLKDEPKA